MPEPIDPSIREALVRALEEAWESGSPVAGSTSEARHRIALIAARRMASFPRRNVPDDDRQRQVRDLARGLAAAFEPDPKLVGELIRDYRYVSELLLDKFAEYL